MEGGMASSGRIGACPLLDIARCHATPHIVKKHENHPTQEARQGGLYSSEGIETDLFTIYTREGTRVKGTI